MVIIWGSGLYGKVDSVPGMCHVATKFGHLWYIPLIPMGSWIVLSQEGNGWRGKEIGFSFKSFVMAWARTALVVGIIAGGIASIVTFNDIRGVNGNPMPFLWAAVSIFSIVGLIGSYYVPGFGKASHARARQIAEELGFDEQGMLLIDMAYGVIDEESARWEMQKIAKRQEREQAVEEPYDI